MVMPIITIETNDFTTTLQDSLAEFSGGIKAIESADHAFGPVGRALMGAE
jgi:hypothetical protein